MSAAVVDLFRYQDAEVRVVVIDDEPWFVAADVARHPRLPHGVGRT